MMRESIYLEEAVAESIREMGPLLYPNTAYGPSLSQWNTYRADGLPSSSVLCERIFGRGKRSAAHWARILASMKLEHPSKSEIQSANRRMIEKEERRYAEQPPALPYSSWRPRCRGERWQRDGLPCIPVERPVMEWHPTRQVWVQAGVMQTYMVR